MLEKDDGVTDVVSYGERLHVSLEGGDESPGKEARLVKLLEDAGVTVLSSRQARPSLEDVFIRRIEARS
jgi:hypothetical protein